MKKLFFALTIVAAIIQTSCSKKSDTTGGAGTLKFTINGTNYSYNVSEGAIVTFGATNIDAVASGSNPNSFSIQMEGTGSGTYTMGGATTGNLIMEYLVNSTTDLYETGHATVSFTESGSTSSATFSGVLYGTTATDSVVITNGSYSGGYNPE